MAAESVTSQASFMFTTIMDDLTATPSATVGAGGGISSPIHPTPSSTPEADTMLSKLVSMTTIAMLSLAITVNLIAFAVVSCGAKRRHTKASIYAASFFTAEIVYCMNGMVSHYQRVFLPYPISAEYEHLIFHGHLFVEFMSRGAMVIALGGVIVDRYRAISDVTSYCPRRQLRVSCCFALAGWLVATLCAVPVLAGLTDYWYTIYHSVRPFDLYVTIHTALFYFLPVLAVSVAYNGLMCQLVACHGKRQSLDSVAAKGDDYQRKARRRLTTGIIATIIVFVCSWLLYLAVRVVDGYFPRVEFDPINMEALRLAGDGVAYLGLIVCPVLVCGVAADYWSIDGNRQCKCCSTVRNVTVTITPDQAWLAPKHTPYYV